jgi:hypothetical protein
MPASGLVTLDGEILPHSRDDSWSKGTCSSRGGSMTESDPVLGAGSTSWRVLSQPSTATEAMPVTVTQSCGPGGIRLKFVAPVGRGTVGDDGR